MKNFVFCLMGPTASGKTDLAMQLCQHFPFEIISVDSALVYRGMNIGTAKPDQATLAQFPHHLVDIINPDEYYSAADFCAAVHKLIKDIEARRKIPLLVGGTMMYYKALQTGLSPLPQANATIRANLTALANTQGWHYLHEQLNQCDPISASRIHPNDTQRIQRALEVFQLTGKPLSHFLSTSECSNDICYINIRLMPANRAWLHENIAKRFKAMIQAGLIEEVRELLQTWHLLDYHPAMRSVGYRQVYMYLQGLYDHVTLEEKGTAATRQLAKRQLTWLRHWHNAHTIIAEDEKRLSKIITLINSPYNPKSTV